MKYFLKALQIMGLISSWSVTALEDGKVTSDEALELIQGACSILGVPLEIDLTKFEVEDEE